MHGFSRRNELMVRRTAIGAVLLAIAIALAGLAVQLLGPADSGTVTVTPSAVSVPAG